MGYNSDNCLVSIIVPLYNSERWLVSCLESLLVQIYTNIEIVVVDDGSTDKSNQICKDYVNKDKRVKLYSQENKGVSSARNLGISKSNGTYICFVDSDDTVNSKYVLNLVTSISKGSAIDIVVNGFCVERILTAKEKTRLQKNSGAIISTTNIQYMFEDLMFMKNGYICSKLFKKEIIDYYNLKFDVNISFSEDLIFFIEFIKKSKRVIFNNVLDYNYQVNEFSLSLTSHYIFNSEYRGIARLNHLIDINEFDSLALKYTSEAYLKFVLRAIIALGQDNEEDKLSKMNLLYKNIAFKQFLYQSSESLSQKVILFLFRNKFFLSVLCFLYIRKKIVNGL